jgi:hypothetical protein
VNGISVDNVLTLAFVTALSAAEAPQPKPPAKAAPKPVGTLAQVMRGIYFPNANLIFDVQQNDPAAPKKKSGETGGSATDTYSGAYSGWEVVENAAVALSDGVDLILTPGRLCQNGKPVPGQRADFQKFAQAMRKAGLEVLQAAHTKNQEKCRTRRTTSPTPAPAATRSIATRAPPTVRPDARRFRSSSGYISLPSGPRSRLRSSGVRPNF